MFRSRQALLAALGMFAFTGFSLNQEWGISIASLALADAPKCDSYADRKCRIEITPVVTSSGCSGTVDPNGLELYGQRDLTIVWQLPANQSYKFCRALGDGVFLKMPAHQSHKQVNRMWLANNDGEEDTKLPDETDCKKRFRWNFKNILSEPVVQYDYEIRFRDENNLATVCRIDPWIKNGSPTLKSPAAKSR